MTFPSANPIHRSRYSSRSSSRMAQYAISFLAPGQDGFTGRFRAAVGRQYSSLVTSFASLGMSLPFYCDSRCTSRGAPNRRVIKAKGICAHGRIVQLPRGGSRPSRANIAPNRIKPQRRGNVHEHIDRRNAYRTTRSADGRKRLRAASNASVRPAIGISNE